MRRVERWMGASTVNSRKELMNQYRTAIADLALCLPHSRTPLSLFRLQLLLAVDPLGLSLVVIQ